MRNPLITPLASRNGTVEKDEKLVNAYAEADQETKETSVFKRSGLSEGDAVISGNDIYGQGLFNYDGYLFTVIGDTLGKWVFVGGLTPGSGGISYFTFGVDSWDVNTTYNIGDQVIHEGTIYYSQTDSNTGNTPSSSDYWDTTEPGVTRYRVTGPMDIGPWTASISSAVAAWQAAWSYTSCPGDPVFYHWVTGPVTIDTVLMLAYCLYWTAPAGNCANQSSSVSYGNIQTM